MDIYINRYINHRACKNCVAILGIKNWPHESSGQCGTEWIFVLIACRGGEPAPGKDRIETVSRAYILEQEKQHCYCCYYCYLYIDYVKANHIWKTFPQQKYL